MSTEELHCFINKNNEEENPDLSEWMTNLPDELKDVPLNQLAIPGSHDSGAFWLNPDLPIAPGKYLTVFWFISCDALHEQVHYFNYLFRNVSHITGSNVINN